jgi:hypothetical protein
MLARWVSFLDPPYSNYGNGLADWMTRYVFPPAAL